MTKQEIQERIDRIILKSYDLGITVDYDEIKTSFLSLISDVVNEVIGEEEKVENAQIVIGWRFPTDDQIMRNKLKSNQQTKRKELLG